MSWAKWKHECDVDNQVLGLIDLSCRFLPDTAPLSSVLDTMGAAPQHNPHHLGFVWREPANYITLISQAVFIQVITMRRTVVKRSICHLNSNDFSIFSRSVVGIY